MRPADDKQPPPLPTEELQLAGGESGRLLHFSATETGEVRVYRLVERPRWPAGTVLPVANLQQLGPALPLLSESVAVDPAPGPGCCYYVPVTLSGTHIAIGPALRHVCVEEVSGCAAEDFDTYVLLRWSWPSDCHQVTLAHRSDGFASGPGDPRASCRRVTRTEYDRLGGIRLEGLAATSHYFVVYASGHFAGEPARSDGISPGARCVLRRLKGALVSYCIKRHWLRRRISIELHTDSIIENLPPLVLVAKPGVLQPIDAEDGTVVAKLSWLRLAPDAPLRQAVELPELRAPFYLRAFFVGPQPTRRYQLVDPPREQLKVL